MKKHIMIILCALLLVLAVIPASAAEDTKITVTPSKTVVQRGDTVDFTVSVSGSTSFTSIAAQLNFDSNVFEYENSTNKNTAGLLVPFDGTSIGLLNTSAQAYSGDLQVLTFRVKDTAPIDASAVTGSASADNGSIKVQFVGTSVSVNCQHSYPKDANGNYIYTQVGADKHQRVCSKCNTPEIQAHTWDEGTTVTAPSCTEDGEEKYTCVICQATKTEKINKLDHLWDNDCDTTCNREGCGYTRQTTHSYRSTWSSDETGHWHECRSCGAKKDFTAHTPGAAATSETAQTCTVCKYEIAPKLEHVHKMSTEWESDSENHWHRCNSGKCTYTEDEAAHEYDNDCDVDCNVCGYIRIPPHNYSMEWRGNATGHWHVCQTCGAQSDIIPHTPGPEATQDTPQVCEECNFTIQMELSHVHEFAQDWYSDDENHWHCCTDSRCSQTDALEPHTWDAGEELPDGTIRYTCTVCAKQVVVDESIETQPTTVPSTGDSASSSTSQKPTEPSGSGSFPWKWAGIAAVALLAVGIVLLVIEFIRSRKKNVRGRFSK